MQGSYADQILERIRSNDKKFIADLRTIIERIARKWNWNNQSHIDDITQDCLAKLIENLQKGKFKEQSSLKTYIYAITRNTCIDYYRSSRVAELIDIDTVTITDPSLSLEDRFIAVERRKIACRVLLSLPKKCRQLWRTVFFGRRTYKQAAVLLGLTEGTVKRQMWECRKLAREILEKIEK